MPVANNPDSSGSMLVWRKGCFNYSGSMLVVQELVQSKLTQHMTHSVWRNPPLCAKNLLTAKLCTAQATGPPNKWVFFCLRAPVLGAVEETKGLQK